MFSVDGMVMCCNAGYNPDLIMILSKERGAWLKARCSEVVVWCMKGDFVV